MNWVKTDKVQVQETQSTGEGRGCGYFLPVCHRPAWKFVLSAAKFGAHGRTQFGRGDSGEDLCFQVVTGVSASHVSLTVQGVVFCIGDKNKKF